MKTRIPWTPFFLLLVFLLASCGQSEDDGAPADAVEARWTAPTAEEIANTTYRGIYDTPIRLRNGLYKGAPAVEGGASRPTVTLVADAFRTADIDGDGEVETVAFLMESSGGSGSNVYLAVVGRRTQGVVNLGTVLIGDRVQIRTVRITDNGIELDVIQKGPSDAMCCPSQKATRVWSLGPYGLREGAPQITGEFSLEDLAGIEWVLAEMGRGTPVVDSIKVTLTISENRVGGSGGCNRYFAEIKETSPGEFVIGSIGSTMMMCPDNMMEVERSYMSTLDAATRYNFLVERLVLTGQRGDAATTLVFVARESPRP